MAKKTLKIADKPTLDEVNEKISGLAQFRGVFVKDVTLPTSSVSLPSVEKKVSTLPYDFYWGSAVVYNNEIHILGGNGNQIAHYKWDGSSWTKVSTLPYDFGSGSAVVLNGEIHILGSSINSNTHRKHYKWDGSSWTEVSTLPYDFYSGSAVVYNSNIHILGSSGNNTSNYKWNGSYWLSMSDIDSCCNSSAVVYNNEIHILGSNSSSYRQRHTRIPTSFYKSYEGPYLFKNQKIYSKYKLVPLENCIENEDSLLVLDNGVVKFGIETNDTEIMLTIV